MEEDSYKNQNIYPQFEDIGKSDYYLLGFSSQYRTNIYKDDEEDIKENKNDSENNKTNKRPSSDSTTISISQDYNNSLSGMNQKKRSDFSKDDFSFNINNINKNIFEFYDRQRKMSSPLCDYLKGYDTYLSRMNQNIDMVDINNSNNFVKKEDFFNPNINTMNNNINDKNKNENNNIDNKKNKDKNYTKRFSYNYNNNVYNNNLPMINNINNVSNININYNKNNNYINNNNNLLFMNNNFPQQIFNINYINLNEINNNTNNPRINDSHILSKRKMSYNIEAEFIQNYFNNILTSNNLNNPNNPISNIQQNQSNINPIFFSNNEEQNNIPVKNHQKPNNKKSEKNKKHKKPFDIRKGDWKCPNCNNLNFSFRTVCNRCQIKKPNNIEEIED